MPVVEVIVQYEIGEPGRSMPSFLEMGQIERGMGRLKPPGMWSYAPGGYYYLSTFTLE